MADAITEHDLITIRFAVEHATQESGGLEISEVAPIFRRWLDAAKEKGANENAVELTALLVSIALQGKRV